ncbi:kinase-like protein [Hypoxylon sp. EC38]|nr:kinase-like protein [Hypoxylon sp. EC38]
MARVISQSELEKAERFGEFTPVYKLDSKTVVKSSKITRLAEAETMRFVRKHTSIPVPEVYNAYKDEESGHTRIIMEFIEGVELEEAWDKYSDAEKEHVINQLRGYMKELRELKGSFIGAIDGSWCDDHYFDVERGGFGPFKSESDFNSGIVRALKTDHPYVHVDITCDLWQEIMKGHEIVLTHNDFAPRNILVQGSKVVAIIDWELSGFYPEYWEYCKALRRPDWESGWIKERALDRILDVWPKELAMVWCTTEIIW